VTNSPAVIPVTVSVHVADVEVARVHDFDAEVSACATPLYWTVAKAAASTANRPIRMNFLDTFKVPS
jgi:hypothetical protein